MDGKINGVRFCKVISIADDADADRIRVRLSPEDNNKADSELDYAFPLLPKMLHIKPKVGEAVLILLATSNDGNSQRYYIGPVISQDHRIYEDPFFMGADSYLRGGYKKFDVAPSTDPEKTGIYPNDDDIVIRGRKNADIQISDDDIRIRAGVKVTNNNNKYKITYNTKNPAYIKLKYHDKGLTDGTMSTVSVVGDVINLLSTNSVNSYELTDRKDLISDEELDKIISEAYRLPYGEKLVDFLITFVEAFMKHTHPFSMTPPNPAYLTSLNVKKAQLLENQQLLSDTVRIN